MIAKIGWKAGAEQFPPADLLHAAEQAERAGFDLIDVSDHIHKNGPGCPPSFDAGEEWPFLFL